MKNTSKLLSVILALAIVISGIAVTTITTNAEDVSGINSTVYYMPVYTEILEEDSNEARVSFENNTKFDATIDELINSSYLVETADATSISIDGEGSHDWFIQKWTGTMKPLASGEVTLIGRKIDNGFVMKVNGTKVYEYWGASHWFDGANDRLAYGTSFEVEAGQEYNVEIYYMELGGGNALEIFATTTPDDLNSGYNLNEVATYDLTMQKYVIGDNTDEFNKLVGIGKGTNDAGELIDGGNGGKCITENWKYNASIDTILAKTRKGEEKVVASFSEPVFKRECYVIKYDGYIEPKVSGNYVFGATKVDNGFYLNIDGTVAYEFWAGGTWNDDDGNTYPTGIALEAGTRYPFTAAYLETNGGEALELVASVDGAAAASVDDLFNFYIAKESGEEVETIDAYAQNMFGLVVTDAYDDTDGVAVPDNPGDNTNGIGNIHNNAWAKVPAVAFGDAGATSITLKYCAKESRMGANGKVAIWVDGKSADENGTLIGTVDLPITGPEYSNFSVVTEDLASAVTGTHDVYFVFTADTNADKPYVANMSYFQFNAAAGSDEGEEEVTSNTKLSATDKEILFYTDFSDISDLVVRKLAVNNWPNLEKDEVVTPTLDADGNMIMAANEYISLGADMLKGHDEIIIEFVVKPDAIVNHAAFASIGSNLPNINEADWFVTGMRDDGAVKFGAKSNGIEAGAGDDGKTEGGLLKVGEWVNIKYEITATTVKVFVNGVEKKSWDVTGQKTLSERAEIENAEFIFGEEMRWEDPGFSGTISEIRVTTTKKADSSTGSAGTGDVASVAAILMAGAAALGGLKLRKKSK